MSIRTHPRWQSLVVIWSFKRVHAWFRLYVKTYFTYLLQLDFLHTCIPYINISYEATENMTHFLVLMLGAKLPFYLNKKY